MSNTNQNCMTKHSIVISVALAQDLSDLLNKTIEYDSAGEPIDSDHSAMLDNLLDLDYLIKHANEQH